MSQSFMNLEKANAWDQSESGWRGGRKIKSCVNEMHYIHMCNCQIKLLKIWKMFIKKVAM